MDGGGACNRGVRGPGREANRSSGKQAVPQARPSSVTSPLPRPGSSGGLAGPASPTPFAVRYDENGDVRGVSGYHFGDELGNGSLGTVLRAASPGGTGVAIKCLSKRRLRRLDGLPKGKKKSRLAQQRSRLELLRQLQHPNIVELIEVLESPTEDRIFIVLELLGEPVMDMFASTAVTRLPEPTARLYFGQLCSAVEYLHGMGVVHRDIKPSNLLLCPGKQQVKLVDFGESQAFEGDNDWMQGDSGTYAFMPPEAVDGTGAPYRGRVADVWSMGVTLYCLVFGELPFNQELPLALIAQIRERPVSFPQGGSVAARTLLRRLLCKAPDSRITLSQIREDAWFRGVPKAIGLGLGLAGSPPRTAVGQAAAIACHETPLPALPTSSPPPVRSPIETLLGQDGPVRIVRPGHLGQRGGAGAAGLKSPRRTIARALYPWRLLRTARPGDSWGAHDRWRGLTTALPYPLQETFV